MPLFFNCFLDKSSANANVAATCICSQLVSANFRTAHAQRFVKRLLESYEGQKLRRVVFYKLANTLLFTHFHAQKGNWKTSCLSQEGASLVPIAKQKWQWFRSKSRNEGFGTLRFPRVPKNVHENNGSLWCINYYTHGCDRSCENAGCNSSKENLGLKKLSIDVCGANWT